MFRDYCIIQTYTANIVLENFLHSHNMLNAYRCNRTPGVGGLWVGVEKGRGECSIYSGPQTLTAAPLENSLCYTELRFLEFQFFNYLHLYFFVLFEEKRWLLIRRCFIRRVRVL